MRSGAKGHVPRREKGAFLRCLCFSLLDLRTFYEQARNTVENLPFLIYLTKRTILRKGPINSYMQIFLVVSLMSEYVCYILSIVSRKLKILISITCMNTSFESNNDHETKLVFLNVLSIIIDD